MSKKTDSADNKQKKSPAFLNTKIKLVNGDTLTLGDFPAYIHEKLHDGKKDDAIKLHRDNLTSPNPIEFTPAYSVRDGLKIAIMHLYVSQGTNRKLSPVDMLNFNPAGSLLSEVKMTLSVREIVINGDEKKKLTSSHSKGNQEAIQNEKKDDESKSDKKAEDPVRIQMRSAEEEDYAAYALLASNSTPVVVFSIELLLSAYSEELLSEQIKILNRSLATEPKNDGAKWLQIPSDQKDRMESFYARIEPSFELFTSTGDNYAGINFSVSNGIFDAEGIPIGQDTLSVTSSSTAMFDFDKHTNHIAMVAMPSDYGMGRYVNAATNSSIPVASLVGQVCANNIIMRGHKAKHLIFNDFDYQIKGVYARPIDTTGAYAYLDASRVTVNPLQGFGNIEDVREIHARLVNKVVDIFDQLNNLQLTQPQRSIVMQAVDDTYLTSGNWTQDAEIHPELTRIVNITDPTGYIKMSNVLQSLKNLEKNAEIRNREMKATDIDTLHSILKNAMFSYTGVLGSPTTVKDTSAANTYYNFSTINDNALKQAQFINLLDYIFYTCEEGDVVVLHGCDKLYKRTIEMATDIIKAHFKKGIRVVMCFDTITSPEIKQHETASIFNLKGTMYSNLDTDVDYTFIGRLNADEVNKYEDCMNTRLSDTLAARMQQRSGCQTLIHRDEGNVNNFIDLSFIV